jgi:hypothetical protein
MGIAIRRDSARVLVVGIRARPVNADAREIEKKGALGSFLLSSFLSVPYSRARRDLLDRDTTGHDRSKVCDAAEGTRGTREKGGEKKSAGTRPSGRATMRLMNPARLITVVSHERILVSRSCSLFDRCLDRKLFIRPKLDTWRHRVDNDDDDDDDNEDGDSATPIIMANERDGMASVCPP